MTVLRCSSDSKERQKTASEFLGLDSEKNCWIESSKVKVRKKGAFIQGNCQALKKHPEMSIISG